MPSCVDGMSLLDKGDAALQSSGSVTGSLRFFPRKVCPASLLTQASGSTGGLVASTDTTGERLWLLFGPISHFFLISYGFPLLSSSC